MNKKCIREYVINEKYYFIGAYIFSYNNWKFLLNSRYGISIILDDYYAQQLESYMLNEDLMFKLLQRGFVAKRNFCNHNENLDIRPNFFLITLTNNCNLGCKYCFRCIEREKSDKIDDLMLLDICKYILNYCKRYDLQNFSIQFWGGEPLLLFDKIIIVQNFFEKHKLKPNYIIETNGTLIDENIAYELKSREIKLGISIDGPASLHDLHRPFINGEPSFGKVLQGINSLNNISYNEYGVITVITKRNIHKVNLILDFFVNELKIHRVKFNFIKKNRFSLESFELSDISDAEIESFFNSLIEKIISLNEDGYQIYERNICDKLMNLLGKRIRNICSSRGCKGGYKIISFDSKGDIFPCDMVDCEGVRIGNIIEGDLIHMIEEAVTKNIFFRKKEISSCIKCPWNGYCKGGCTASILYNGEVAIDEMECRVNNILYPKLVYILLAKPEVIKYLTNNQIDILRR